MLDRELNKLSPLYYYDPQYFEKIEHENQKRNLYNLNYPSIGIEENSEDPKEKVFHEIVEMKIKKKYNMLIPAIFMEINQGRPVIEFNKTDLKNFFCSLGEIRHIEINGNSAYVLYQHFLSAILAFNIVNEIILMEENVNIKIKLINNDDEKEQKESEEENVKTSTFIPQKEKNYFTFSDKKYKYYFDFKENNDFNFTENNIYQEFLQKNPKNQGLKIQDFRIPQNPKEMNKQYLFFKEGRNYIEKSAKYENSNERKEKYPQTPKENYNNNLNSNKYFPNGIFNIPINHSEKSNKIFNNNFNQSFPNFRKNNLTNFPFTEKNFNNPICANSFSDFFNKNCNIWTNNSSLQQNFENLNQNNFHKCNYYFKVLLADSQKKNKNEEKFYADILRKKLSSNNIFLNQNISQNPNVSEGFNSTNLNPYLNKLKFDPTSFNCSYTNPENNFNLQENINKQTFYLLHKKQIENKNTHPIKNNNINLNYNSFIDVNDLNKTLNINHNTNPGCQKINGSLENFQTNNQIKNTNKFICNYEIQIENEDKFRVTKRIIGNKGLLIKSILFDCVNKFSDYSLKIRLRGKGSGFREGIHNSESDEPLQLCVSTINNECYFFCCKLIDDFIFQLYREYSEFLVKNKKNCFGPKGVKKNEFILTK